MISALENSVPEQKVNVVTRIGSMILDHFIMTLIAFLFGLPMMIGNFVSALQVSHNQGQFRPFDGPLLYVALIGFALYFCKDCIQGRSIAKRITKLQVIDNVTGEVASPLQCFVRNIFCVIWPVEFVFTLINPSRRIGDYVARTRVAHYNPNGIVQPRAFTAKLIIPLVLSFGLWCLFMLPFQMLNFASPKAKYIESSYNPIESKEIETLFADSLVYVLSANVRVYDKVEKEEVKYVSIICTLKENYLDNYGTKKQLTDLTKELLYSKFPQNTITGQAKYIYRQPGFFKSTSHDIGRPISNRN